MPAWLDILELLDAPAERIYWPYLLAALVLAFLWAALKRDWALLRRDLFSKAIWWHPSARLDYALIIFRALLSALLLAPFLISAHWVAVKVVLAVYAVLGAPPSWPFSPLVTTVFYTAALFMISDASRYYIHRWMHQVAWLWRFHQIHHSAEVMTPFTLYRTHPVEGLIGAFRGILVTGVIGGIFGWLTHGQAHAAQIMGVNAVAFFFNLAGSNLRHSHVWLSFGPLERIFMSPAQHQDHHALETRGQNNYGSFLALWDRLHHTWRPALKKPAQFGLAPEDRLHHPHHLGSVLLAPFGLWPDPSSRAVAAETPPHPDT